MALSNFVSQSVLDFSFLFQLCYKIFAIVHKRKFVSFILDSMSFPLWLNFLFVCIWGFKVPLRKIIKLIMFGSFAPKLDVSVLICKTNLVDQIWLDYFDVVVLFYVQLALVCSIIHLHLWHMGLEVYYICLLQCAFMTLDPLGVVFACVGHYTVGLQVGD